jgi:hypothetical protein
VSTLPGLGCCKFLRGVGVLCDPNAVNKKLILFLLFHTQQYVDLDYQGGGIGEYSYYDAYKNSWDESACEIHGNGRCAPMDCHDSSSTTWTLMGVFKEAEYYGNDAFFEQLFKHEGVCVWNNDDTYDFMSEARESSWTQGCVKTGTCVSGQCLYLDLKPTLNGNMTYGLYQDEICKTEYIGSAVSVDDIAKKMGLLYGSSLDQWNDAMEVFKVCQPCMAYNLGVTSPSSSYSNNYGDDNGDYYYGDDPNEGYFQCDDDADYTNVNQCMKYRSHADLEVATWEDLAIATEQGGILDVNISGTIFGQEKMNWYQQQKVVKLQNAKKREEAEYQALLRSVPNAAPVLLFSLIVMALGPLTVLYAIYWVYKQRGGQSRIACVGKMEDYFEEPLVEACGDGGDEMHIAACGEECGNEDEIKHNGLLA